ncbi:hypothetical protein ACH9DO_08095 [Kocuria sp. M1N1S27]|uniref:hypothetical protein n=1 Tax=Kocuria kalidii TaxID=3376283 RepID=UPI003792050D
MPDRDPHAGLPGLPGCSLRSEDVVDGGRLAPGQLPGTMGAGGEDVSPQPHRHVACVTAVGEEELDVADGAGPVPGNSQRFGSGTARGFRTGIHEAWVEAQVTAHP